jgi:hypothetical protein
MSFSSKQAPRPLAVDELASAREALWRAGRALGAAAAQDARTDPDLFGVEVSARVASLFIAPVDESTAAEGPKSPAPKTRARRRGARSRPADRCGSVCQAGAVAESTAAAYSEDIPLALQRTILEKAFAPAGLRLAFIDAAKLKVAFTFTGGVETPLRAERFRRFITGELGLRGVGFEAPMVSSLDIAGGQLTRVTFRNGNHRAENLLKGGMEQIPIALAPSLFEKLSREGLIHGP